MKKKAKGRAPGKHFCRTTKVGAEGEGREWAFYSLGIMGGGGKE